MWRLIINDKQKLFAFDECEWILGTIFKPKFSSQNPAEYFRKAFAHPQNFGFKVVDVLAATKIHSQRAKTTKAPTNEVAGRKCFHRCLSVHGGVSVEEGARSF